MRQIMGSITGRGQVTLPAEVRRLLGVQPGEKVIFEIDGNQVRLLRPQFTLETAYRSVPPLSGSDDVEVVIERTKEERVEAFTRELCDQ
jgi:antitoxin PrlF